MGKVTPWTPRELADLERMYKDPDYTIDEIVHNIGRSENAIRLKASRSGWSRPVIEFMNWTSGDNKIRYNEDENTLRILAPVDIDEVLTFICEIKQNQEARKIWGIPA